MAGFRTLRDKDIPLSTRVGFLLLAFLAVFGCADREHDNYPKERTMCWERLRRVYADVAASEIESNSSISETMKHLREKSGPSYGLCPVTGTRYAFNPTLELWRSLSSKEVAVFCSGPHTPGQGKAPLALAIAFDGSFLEMTNMPLWIRTNITGENKSSSSASSGEP